MDQILQTIAASGPLALVLGIACYHLWRAYRQEAEEHKKTLRRATQDLLAVIREAYQLGDTGEHDEDQEDG